MSNTTKAGVNMLKVGSGLYEILGLQKIQQAREREREALSTHARNIVRFLADTLIHLPVMFLKQICTQICICQREEDKTEHIKQKAILTHGLTPG